MYPQYCCQIHKINIDTIPYLINSSYSRFVKVPTVSFIAAVFAIQDSARGRLLYLTLLSLYLSSSSALSFMLYWHFWRILASYFMECSSICASVFLMIYMVFLVKLNKWRGVLLRMSHPEACVLCPLLVMLILIIWLRHCLVSALCSYPFLAYFLIPSI